MTRKRFIALTAIFSALLIAIPFVCSEKLSESSYSVRSEKIRSDIKLAFISDLHNTLYGKEMSELIASVDKYSPDIVIFGGDLFDRRPGEPNSLRLVKDLAARYPCFYSIGNHEIKENIEYGDIIKSDVSSLGVTVLDGRYSDITVNGSTIRIMGVDGGSSRDQLDNCRKALSDEIYSVLIEHFPEDFPSLSGLGFDLVLSGHAHGGQWRFPPLINGVFSPGEGFFPKYTCGIYEENGSKMLVSRGLQRCPRDLLIPRIFNRPEIMFITLGAK